MAKSTELSGDNMEGDYIVGMLFMQKRKLAKVLPLVWAGLGLMTIFFPDKVGGLKDIMFKCSVWGTGAILLSDFLSAEKKAKIERMMENFDFKFGNLKLTVHCTMLDYVLQKTQPGDLKGLIEEMDAYAKKNWMMNLGDVKGELIDQAIKDHGLADIKVGLELGGFCGYSAVRLANVFGKHTKLHTVEPNPLCSAVQSRILTHAGIHDRVIQNHMYSMDYIKTAAAKGMRFDFVFMDHHKDHYKSDLIEMINLKLLNKGALVIVDNCLNPGAPDLLQYMKDMEGKMFKHKVIDTFLEYSNKFPDQVVIAEFLGN